VRSPAFFLLYINNLTKIPNRDSNMVLYAGGTSIIITDTNRSNFKINLNRTFKKINTWFNTSLLNLESQENSIFGIWV
jgi:hypothetical protein